MVIRHDCFRAYPTKQNSIFMGYFDETQVAIEPFEIQYQTALNLNIRGLRIRYQALGAVRCTGDRTFNLTAPGLVESKN